MKKIITTTLIIVLTIFKIYAEESSKIIILRPFHFGAAMATAYGGKQYYNYYHFLDINGDFLGNIASMSYHVINVPPGKYTITGYAGLHSYEDLKTTGVKYSIEITTTANQTYYASIDEKEQTIALINEKKWQKELKKKFPVKWLSSIEYKNNTFYDTNGNVIGGNQQTINENADKNSSSTNNQNIASQDFPPSDVDQNIPITKHQNRDTYVLIISNEDYEKEMDVEFAENDGKIFKEYCIKTLGIPTENIEFKPNATVGDIHDGVDWLENVLNYIDNSRAIVFYSGHGINDEKTSDAYIIPVDGQAKIIATCFSLNSFYKRLASTKSGKVTYFMDACFTGAGKDGSMLIAARAVAREPKKEILTGNTIVFSATNADQTAMPYKDKRHGLFTYFLLKKLQETEGNITYQELYNYISQNVNKKAVMVNRKPQTPTVSTSPNLHNTWGTTKLK